ncbi:DUF1302 family protein, partial [Klebsiella pneumoniae]
TVLGVYNNPALIGQSQAAFGALGLYQGPGGKTFVYPGDQIAQVAKIGGDLNAKNDGQYGVAFRYIAEELNSTEFGFYFVNYHGKEPSIYADLNGYQGVNVGSLAGVLGNSLAGGLAT